MISQSYYGYIYFRLTAG